MSEQTVETDKYPPPLHTSSETGKLSANICNIILRLSKLHISITVIMVSWFSSFIYIYINWYPINVHDWPAFYSAEPKLLEIQSVGISRLPHSVSEIKS
jgi:hypothetical protein